jgi:16S rRNA (guanine966-N2)-methyltransferase
MRVIAGSAKGQRLKSPVTGTRPMMDRMKESVFSALGEIQDIQVLDLYAGSGSLGLEALSRGAKRAVFVENAREAILKLEQNVESTGLTDRSDVTWIDVKAMLMRPSDERFDLIFLDPPYNMPAGSVRADCEAIVMQGFLSDAGRLVVHRPQKESKLVPLGLKLSWEREFGQSRVYVFGHEDEDGEGA